MSDPKMTDLEQPVQELTGAEAENATGGLTLSLTQQTIGKLEPIYPTVLSPKVIDDTKGTVAQSLSCNYCGTS
jgi:hypothetical protein